MTVAHASWTECQRLLEALETLVEHQWQSLLGARGEFRAHCREAERLAAMQGPEQSVMLDIGTPSPPLFSFRFRSISLPLQGGNPFAS